MTHTATGAASAAASVAPVSPKSFMFLGDEEEVVGGILLENSLPPGSSKCLYPVPGASVEPTPTGS